MEVFSIGLPIGMVSPEKPSGVMKKALATEASVGSYSLRTGVVVSRARRRRSDCTGKRSAPTASSPARLRAPFSSVIEVIRASWPGVSLMNPFGPEDSTSAVCAGTSWSSGTSRTGRPHHRGA